MTQAELAELWQISLRRVQKFEADEAEAPRAFAFAMSAILLGLPPCGEDASTWTAVEDTRKRFRAVRNKGG